jgi:hypothetical protein
MANPVVFFDMTIGGAPAGRIEMTLRADVVPKTVEVSDGQRFKPWCRQEGTSALKRAPLQPSRGASHAGPGPRVAPRFPLRPPLLLPSPWPMCSRD